MLKMNQYEQNMDVSCYLQTFEIMPPLGWLDVGSGYWASPHDGSSTLK